MVAMDSSPSSVTTSLGLITTMACEKVIWGRKAEAVTKDSLKALVMVAFAPLWVLLNWIALTRYDGSITAAITALWHVGLLEFLQLNQLQPTLKASLGYAAWFTFQGFLYAVLPGPKCFGQRTPGGLLLGYVTNGLNAWVVTHVLYMAASIAGLLDPAIIARHWEGLLVAANVTGFVLALLFQVKGYYWPTFKEDQKMSGSILFDFWGGVELNPRFFNLDLKLFLNGRPGIVAWTLIDLSWAAYQYQTLGYVTYSMIVLNILHAAYVVDFFWNESWYTRTIDITHDHLGFMLTWGDTTFLPALYTLQAQYLAYYPVHLTGLQATFVCALGLMGYTIFRISNHQRDDFRAKHGQVQIWGAPAEFMKCSYRTDDGKLHYSLLLTSGWWGFSRHSNYLGDLILSFAVCATCGFSNILPWSYFIFMFTFLQHRTWRDERRCLNKYGEQWNKYCEIVPYRLIPYIY